jgi:protein-S-isoprenylcysteine O-methyltransferase Ste14
MKESNNRRFLIISYNITILFIIQIILSLFFYNWAGISIVTYIGWLFIIISVIIIYKSQMEFRAVKKTDQETKKLVFTGMFSIIRHSMYLAFMIMAVGLIFISQYVVVFIIGLIRILMLYYVILEEEKMDLKRFGREYRDYQKKVPILNFINGI